MAVAQPGMAPIRSRPLLALLLATVALLAGACGGEEADPEAQPRVDTSTFGSGAPAESLERGNDENPAQYSLVLRPS